MAIVQELVSNLTYEVALAPAAAAVADNTAQVSGIIDTRGYEHVTFVILTGALADADATFAVTMHHGDAANLSDATTVDTACLVGTLADAGFTFAADNAVRKVGYTPGKGGGKRYVRITVTPSANTGAAPMAILAAKLPLQRPAA